jgi:hypothetical protein
MVDDGDDYLFLSQDGVINHSGPNAYGFVSESAGGWLSDGGHTLFPTYEMAEQWAEENKRNLLFPQDAVLTTLPKGWTEILPKWNLYVRGKICPKCNRPAVHRDKDLDGITDAWGRYEWDSGVYRCRSRVDDYSDEEDDTWEPCDATPYTFSELHGGS